MTNNQLRETAESFGLSLTYVRRWEVPENTTAIIAMPNIPRPLHLQNPRNLLGTATWNRMRRACYAAANMTCEICGKKLERGMADAHEVYDIDYENGTAVFKRTVCACRLCHRYGIHSGRCITLYKSGNPLMSRETLLSGAENVFTIISSYNSTHGDKPLRCYSTMIEYLKCDELREPMLDLIKKYEISFYSEDPKTMAKWGDWNLVIGNKHYPTPYKNEKAWKEAMEKQGDKDTDRILQKKMDKIFSGEVYNELNKILEGGTNEPATNRDRGKVDNL